MDKNLAEDRRLDFPPALGPFNKDLRGIAEGRGGRYRPWELVLLLFSGSSSVSSWSWSWCCCIWESIMVTPLFSIDRRGV